MKHFKIIVVGGLCLSLLLNYILITRIKDINNTLNHISNNNQHIMNTVNSQMGYVSNAINRMQEEQSWLSRVDVRTELSDTHKNQGSVNFEWQVKELQSNSEVHLNYRIAEGEEYTSVKAEPSGNGFFRVELPIDMDVEPIWNIGISRNVGVSRNGISNNVEVVVDEKYPKQNRMSFSYYISVSHDETIKNSDINIFNIEEIGAQYYGYLDVYGYINENINDNNNYNLTVMNGNMYNTSVFLKDAFLKKYNDGRLIDEEKFVNQEMRYYDGTPAREDSLTKTISSEDNVDYNRLVLKVVYSDGSVFEREIYSK
ncbi:hypothetical protein EDC18_102238 [Natranaerovirga pectinivora]|uniref:Uncharacterized protein n=1 Tax=Natranaerovirga pectinivora TaxID=682400 RepID=A0A4R3MPM0_9FIRM|nr:hypothetical protein [Natranaerovirga pectinivora]TCT16221.1 hypothetical protein EDC18_102238 [Natranaerovirga pectinivora]